MMRIGRDGKSCAATPVTGPAATRASTQVARMDLAMIVMWFSCSSLVFAEVKFRAPARWMFSAALHCGRDDARSSGTVIIDAHAHYVPQAFLDDMASQRRSFPSVKITADDGSLRFAFAANEPKRPVAKGMSDAQGRRRWLAERGIDKQVVGGWLDLFGFDLPGGEGADWGRLFN